MLTRFIRTNTCIAVLALAGSAATAQEVLPAPPATANLTTASNLCCSLSCTTSAPTAVASVAVPKWNLANGTPTSMRLRFHTHASGSFSGTPTTPAFGGYATNGRLPITVSGPGVNLAATVAFPDCGGGISPSTGSIACGWSPQDVSSQEVSIPAASWASYMGTGTVSVTLSVPFSTTLAMSGTCATYHQNATATTTIELVVNACRADFNQSGGVGVQDIFDFLAAWFAGDPRCDVNGANGVNVQDIFDFLGAWFAGC